MKAWEVFVSLRSLKRGPALDIAHALGWVTRDRLGAVIRTRSGVRALYTWKGTPPK